MKRVFISLLLAAFSALGQEFEVVSVKPNRSASGDSNSNSDRGMLTATNMSLRSLIVRAYGMKDYQVVGPDWLGSERFDVAAKFPEALPKDSEKGAAMFRAMLKHMLVERFKLAVHSEQKTFPVYGLTVGKSGIPFKEATECNSHGMQNKNAHFTGTCISMDSFAGFLARQTDLPMSLPVLDMTGLKGFYDLTLSWTRETRAAGGDDPVAAEGPSLAAALQDQLGLKLETRKAPIEILVVDHAEKVPTEN